MTSSTRTQLPQLSRRTLLRLAGTGAGLLGLSTLAGCAPSAPGSSPLVWGNWTFTMDFDEETQNYPTLEQFTKQSGIPVDFLEDIDDSATFYAKIREQLQKGSFPGYDLFNFADDFTARVIENGEVQEINHANIPNLANVLPLMSSPAYDPTLQYSVPWQGGMTGLCYNTKLYPKGIRSMADLTEPALEGRVSVLSEMTDTVGLTLLGQGVDVSGDWGDAEFERALAEISERVELGQYAQVKGNSYTQDLQSGNIWAAMCWSGDVQVLNDEAGEELFKWVIPEEGGTKYVNSILVPRGTERMADIEQLIDFYYQPDVMAEVTAYTASVPPVTGVREELAKIDPALADSPMLFPSEKDAERIYDFRLLTPAETKTYTGQFLKVLGL